MPTSFLLVKLKPGLLSGNWCNVLAVLSDIALSERCNVAARCSNKIHAGVATRSNDCESCGQENGCCVVSTGQLGQWWLYREGKMKNTKYNSSILSTKDRRISFAFCFPKK